MFTFLRPRFQSPYGPCGELSAKRRRGRPGLPVPNSPYGLCGRKATLSECPGPGEPAWPSVKAMDI